MIYAVIMSLLVMGGSFALTYQHLPDQVPLFYSQPWGEDQLAEYWTLALLPILLIVFFLLNKYIANKLFPGNDFIKQIVAYVTFTTCIILTLVFVKIITLVS